MSDGLTAGVACGLWLDPSRNQFKTDLDDNRATVPRPGYCFASGERADSRR